jgi:acyl-CoA thioester hydrolase
MSYRHPLRVRYSEVDNQGYVYHSRYLEFVDHAFTMWLRHQGLIYEELRHDAWDCVLRHAEVEWLTSARADEELEVDCQLVKIGSTSFEMVYEVLRGDTVCYRQRTVYVSIDPTTADKVETPSFVRDRLGRPAAR